MAPLLSVSDLTVRRDDNSGSAIIQGLNLEVREDEVLVIVGPSGSGKTTILKCIAELNVYHKGEIRMYGNAFLEAKNHRSAKVYGIPSYRTRVQYVPQRPSLLPGTPLDLIQAIQSFASRSESGHIQQDAMRIAEDWGIDSLLWMREWSTLSGGEGQRMALAIALGAVTVEILLLDEPTSALDSTTTLRVEKTLQEMLHDASNNLKAILWITHDAAQADRVGTRRIDITA